MFKIQSIALTVALFGYGDAQSGCYPTYSPGASYSVDDWVSATVTTTTPQNFVQQTDGTWLDTGGVTTTTTHNYKCISADWCSNSGYAPGSLYESSAWSKDATVCSVSFVFDCLSSIASNAKRLNLINNIDCFSSFRLVM